MTLLAPWALVWLGSVPILLWLWRLAATRRQVRVPSLIPFEHLLRRQSRQRTRLVVNPLFWLQLAALIALALSLSQPILFRARAKTTLVLFDNSASLGARARATQAFERARHALLARIARKPAADQMFIMMTSPVAPLLPQPTDDADSLARAVRAATVSRLGGNLSTALRIGRALLPDPPQRIVVVTDEAEPRPLDPLVQWVGVGAPLPNAAVVSLEHAGSLCLPEEPRLLATVQNFSTSENPIALTAFQNGKSLAQAAATLAPNGRVTMPLHLPAGTTGVVRVTLAARDDALALDNEAQVPVGQTKTLPIVVQSSSPGFAQTMASWLGACEGLQWSADVPHDHAPFVLITDHPLQPPASSVAVMAFEPPRDAGLVRSYWAVSPDHPIGSYVAPLEVVAARLHLTAGIAALGAPVISALIDGRSVPVVVADERDGRRTVRLLFDPAGSPASTPVLLAFFNSLRWIMEKPQPPASGEPMLLSPLESNLLERPSTWNAAGLAGATEPAPSRAPSSRRLRYPLASLIVWLILVLLLLEWWRSTRGRPLVTPPPSPPERATVPSFRGAPRASPWYLSVRPWGGTPSPRFALRSGGCEALAKQRAPKPPSLRLPPRLKAGLPAKEGEPVGEAVALR